MRFEKIMAGNQTDFVSNLPLYLPSFIHSFLCDCSQHVITTQVGTDTRQAHILGFLPTWAPNDVHFNVRQKTSGGLIFTSLKEKVVVLLFDFNDRMTLEETSKYFSAVRVVIQLDCCNTQGKLVGKLHQANPA